MQIPFGVLIVFSGHTSDERTLDRLKLRFLNKKRRRKNSPAFGAKSRPPPYPFHLILERTRGAGAPEVLRRETAEEEFRLRRNQPLNMAPSAPKYRYCQADFCCATFSKNRFFGGPGK